MGGLGDLFGAIGEAFGGFREANEDGVPGYLAARSDDDDETGGDEDYDATTAVDRYLTGGPRALNLNDL
jgi:hypothetical protein